MRHLLNLFKIFFFSILIVVATLMDLVLVAATPADSTPNVTFYVTFFFLRVCYHMKVLDNLNEHPEILYFGGIGVQENIDEIEGSRKEVQVQQQELENVPIHHVLINCGIILYVPT